MVDGSFCLEYFNLHTMFDNMFIFHKLSYGTFFVPAFRTGKSGLEAC